MPEGKIDIIDEPLEQEVAFYYGNLTEEQLGLIAREYNYETLGGDIPLMVFVLKELVKPLMERIKQRYVTENTTTISETAETIGSIL